MSEELLSLIGGATNRVVRWHDVVMLNNVGVIPPVNDTPGDFVWNRGFNVVVLGGWGTPQYFCKCRVLHDERLQHEAESMVALHTTAALTKYIPPTSEVHSDKIRVLITQFMKGRPLNDLIGHGFGRRMRRLVRHVLDGVVDLAEHATAELPQLVHTPDKLDLAPMAAELCHYLCDIGLAKTDAAALMDVMGSCETLPRQLQHGDLWPANVMLTGRTLRFLDFEMYGRVQVPMYDVFHFLRSSTDHWVPPKSIAWIDRILSRCAISDMVLTEIRRVGEKLALDATQVLAALIFYVMHFAVTTHRRNPDGRVWELFFHEATVLGERVRGGGLNAALLSDRP